MKIVAAALAFAATMAVVPAAAQSTTPEVRRLDVTIGGGLLTGSDLGHGDANLRAPGDQAFRLFATSSRVDRSAFLEARIGFALTPRFTVEGRATTARPQLRTDVTNDVEGAPPVTVSEQLSQYVFDGGVLVNLAHHSRLQPFASVGVGYVRQLHEGLTLIEDGAAYRVGGGIKSPLSMRDSGFIRGTGVRVDAGIEMFSGGAKVADGPRPHAAISGSFFLTF